MSNGGPRRFIDIFPPGFNTKPPNSRGRYHFSTEQLYHRVTRDYRLDYHIESTLVKSVWYGKQKKGAQHEFILIEVEDTTIKLTNYVVLGRNIDGTSGHTGTGGRSLSAGGGRLSMKSTMGNCLGLASDTFTVSFDGIEKDLLKECHLLPRDYLEKLNFSSTDPLYFYQLVTLANVVSKNNPNYVMAYHSSHWFAGLIWECLRHLRPGAHYEDRLSKKRGKFLTLRYTPTDQERNEICNSFKNDMPLVETVLLGNGKGWRLMPEADGQSESTDRDPELSSLNELNTDKQTSS